MFKGVISAITETLATTDIGKYIERVRVYKDICPVVDFSYKGLRFSFDFVPAGDDGLFSIDIVQRDAEHKFSIIPAALKARLGDGLALDRCCALVEAKVGEIMVGFDAWSISNPEGAAPVAAEEKQPAGPAEKAAAPAEAAAEAAPKVKPYSFEDIENLPETLEYVGEFGAELVLFLPFVNWLSRVGLLKNRKIVTYAGMKCFYENLECAGYREKAGRRQVLQPARRPSWLPVKSEHNFDVKRPSPFHFFPNFRAHFLAKKLDLKLSTREKPLLIVHNKFTKEFGREPINHIPIPVLERIFNELKSTFSIVYIRHGMAPIGGGFVEDHNHFLGGFDDWGLLRRHPEVKVFDDLYAEYRASTGNSDVNLFKMMLYARCYRFISCQGGGAHQIAMMSGSLMSILHIRGQELNWGYYPGFYSYMARIPPMLAIARTHEEMEQSIDLFKGSFLATDRCLPGPGGQAILQDLSPARKR